jgi:polar amino acid transport system permease protein
MEELIFLYTRYVPEFIEGTKTTLWLTGISLLVGFIIGLPIALARIYGGGWIRKLVIGYVEVFRGTPLLVQLFIIYYGLPEFGITLSQTASAIVSLGLNSAAYQAEYFRGAIQAIDSGQIIAARAVGMSHIKAIRYVVLPQAFRLVIPAWSNEAIGLLKASAVVFLIAMPDLMAKAKIIAGRYFSPIESYLAVAVAYILLVLFLSIFLSFVERRVKIPGLEIETAR